MFLEDPQFFIQGAFGVFVLLDPLVGQTCGFLDRGRMTGQSSEGAELSCAFFQRHLRVPLGDMVGQVDDIFIRIFQAW